jgi:putative oxidoreductase
MKKVTPVASIVLGLVFVIFGLNFFLKFLPIPSPPADSPAAQFMGAMYVTGMLAGIKILEIAGGVLVAIPRTRNIGLLVLGPIVVNILLFNILIAPGGWTQPPVLLITVLSAFLLWAGRRQFKQLLD